MREGGNEVSKSKADPTRVRHDLEAAAAAQEIILVRRAIARADELEGYVVELSPDWFLLHLLDESIFLNGYVALRVADVRRVKVIGAPDSFEARALRHFGQQVRRPEGIDLTSTAGLLTTVAEHYPVVSIHFEEAEPDSLRAGKVLGTLAGVLMLHEISPEATWDEQPTMLPISCITRVDFGGRYEEALAAVGGVRPGKPTRPLRM